MSFIVLELLSSSFWEIVLLPFAIIFSYFSVFNMFSALSLLPENFCMNGEIIVNSMYIPITTFMYFFKLPSGSIISIIVPIITATIIPCPQLLKKSIIFFHGICHLLLQLIITPVFEIFITRVTPIISIVDMLHKIASNSLNVFPIWPQ